MESAINYTLRAELHNRKDEEKLQSYLFERRYRMKYIGKRGQNSTHYDPELKMHFENKSSLSFIYEIGVDNDIFTLPDKLEKAADFHRRVHYMFDWIQLQVNANGELTKTRNVEDLKQQWGKIEEALLSDYKGKEVDKFLSDINAKFDDEGVLFDNVRQYFNFGLLFLSIPARHQDNWQHKRLIEFSAYEEEKFEEQITFIQENDDMRIYSLSIRPGENSDVELEQYEGKVIIPKNDILPLSVLVEIVFRKDGVANQWYFKLERN